MQHQTLYEIDATSNDATKGRVFWWVKKRGHDILDSQGSIPSVDEKTDPVGAARSPGDSPGFEVC
jgi:hypothetical protein